MRLYLASALPDELRDHFIRSGQHPAQEWVMAGFDVDALADTLEGAALGEPRQGFGYRRARAQVREGLAGVYASVSSSGHFALNAVLYAHGFTSSVQTVY